MDILESLGATLIPPHKAGWPFIIGGLAVTVLGLILWHLLAWAGLLFTLFCLYFFRDPERVPPARAGVVVAPADGTVADITRAAPPAELDCGTAPLTRVSIFLSVLDVHVNRCPVSATVEKVAYHPGLFLNAATDKASDDNERNALLLNLADGRKLVVVQIAGLIARRILCSVRVGQALALGERFGIIRFGSRTDVYLPEGVEPLVSVGQRMVGGETVIATL